MTMPKGRKRKVAPKNSENRSKRIRKLSPEAEVDKDVIVIDDEDDDLAEILAQIKQQEESEKLAAILQDGRNNSSGSGDVLFIDDTSSDEALARRLEQEWADQMDDNDVSPIPRHSDLVHRSRSSDDIVETSQPVHHNRPSKSVPPSRNKTSALATSTKGDTPDLTLSEFRDLFTADRECTQCGKVVKSPRGHVMFTGDYIPPTVTMLMHAPCSSCRTNHCRGCFTPVSCPISCKGISKNPKCTILNCCAEGRAVAIFETLGGFDRQYIGERATSESRALASMTKMKSSNYRSVGPGGTGYGMGHTGYGMGSNLGGARYSGRSRKESNPETKSSSNQQLATHWEEIVTRALHTLTQLLPSPYAESVQTFDLLPHASIGPLLSLSKLPEHLDSLLCNDSVTDWIARDKTYHAMISLMRRMADCELTVQVLIGQRWEMAKSPGLESWMWKEGDIEWVKGKDNTVESISPLYERFEKLARQCEAFLAGASQIMDSNGEENDEEHETTVQAASLCGDIIAAKGDMERVMSVLGITSSLNENPSSNESLGGNFKGKGKNRDFSVELEKAYSVACEKLAFKHVILAVDDGKKLSYTDYNFATTLEHTQDRTRNAKDRLHLIKELAVMATSLPPGVWVRVDEIRNDAIKILIAGPEGTPYAGGLFEFDCFMPIEYPHMPPLMHLRTTGGGSVRFNPNLYNCGKVCLSLLGTWPGQPEEQWSSRSTLLQVLVSIQSMIFIDAPYFNEPGYGAANLKSPASIAYNKNVSMNTVRWAIVDWLDDSHQNSIWREVITSHLRIRKEKIRQKIVEWASDDPRIRSFIPEASLMGMSRAQSNLPTPSPRANALDLLKEFDAGMDRIANW